MKNFIFLFFCFLWICYGWCGDWNYCVTVEIEEKELKEFQKVASVVLPLKGSIKEDGADIRIFDEREKPVYFFIRKIDKEKVDILFETTDSNIYKVYYGNKDSFKIETELKCKNPGQLLLDDFLPPFAKTSGFWIWKGYPKISGDFSHAGLNKKNFFHSTSIIPVKFKLSDKLLQYVFLDEKEIPEEIMIKIQTSNETFFFSWGKDIIKWKNIKKINMGKLPSGGKWTRIEIPLKEIKKQEITGIGFYNYGGICYWDRTSIGEVPLKTKIIKMEEKNKFLSAYFIYNISPLLRVDKKDIYLLNFDGSVSSGAKFYNWVIDGKNYSGETLSLAMEKKDRINIMLKVKNEEGQEDIFQKEIFLFNQKPLEVKINLNILPYSNFLYPKEESQISFKITNLTPIPLQVNTKFMSERKKFVLFPREDNSSILYFNFTVEKEKQDEEIEIFLENIRIIGRKISFCPVDKIKNLIVEGPFLKDENGNFLVCIIPEFEIKEEKLQKENHLKIGIIGNFPIGMEEKLKKLLLENGIDTEIEIFKLPDEISYHILSNFSFILKNFSTDEKKYDLFFLFPSLDTLLKKTPVEEWAKSTDAIIYILRKCTKKIILFSPFPSLPFLKMFSPYASALESIAISRGILFINLNKLYTEIPEWEKFFQIGEKIYQNFPNSEGTDILCKYILKKIIE